MVPKEKQDTPTYYRKEQTTMSSTPSPKSQKMTEGNITKLLITFALPLFVGNLFQQFYNTVDSIVVGILSVKQLWQRLVPQTVSSIRSSGSLPVFLPAQV